MPTDRTAVLDDDLDDLVGHVGWYARHLRDTHVHPRLCEYVIMSHRRNRADIADLLADPLRAPGGGSAPTWPLPGRRGAA